MKVITLLNSEWLRGTEVSTLLRTDDYTIGRQQCCIGVALTQLGVDDEDIDGLTIIDDVHAGVEIPQELKRLNTTHADKNLLAKIACFIGGTQYFTFGADLAYRVNDSPYLTDEVRLDLLNELAEPVGLKFELVEDLSHLA